MSYPISCNYPSPCPSIPTTLSLPSHILSPIHTTLWAESPLIFLSSPSFLDKLQLDWLCAFAQVQTLPYLFCSPGSDDRSIRLWDLKTGQCKYVLKAHTCADVRFDDDKVITASFDNTVGMWDWETGERLQCFRGHTAAGKIKNINRKKILSDSTYWQSERVRWENIWLLTWITDDGQIFPLQPYLCQSLGILSHLTIISSLTLHLAIWLFQPCTCHCINDPYTGIFA